MKVLGVFSEHQSLATKVSPYVMQPAMQLHATTPPLSVHNAGEAKPFSGG
jgi:hypothetical protein